MSSVSYFPIVGIGASAGALDTLRSFFSKIPADLPAAFVVIQHLSPNHKSMMGELLSKHTSLNVSTAKHGEMVKSGCVYLIPRKKILNIFDNRFFLEDKNPKPSMNEMPINIFFRSLADNSFDRAIGIILSGTGSDGSQGVKAIQNNGGLIIVQSPKEANFDGMPKNAIATGAANFVLPVDKIAAKVSEIIYRLSENPNQHVTFYDTTDRFISQLILFIKDKFDHDFSYYKQSTIERRINRRIVITQQENIKNYYNYLKTSEQEQRILFRELFISVTRFFRDREAYDKLSKYVFPQLLNKNQPNKVVRIWSAGCSTGEEAYSIAILVYDYLEKNNLELDFKVFATDVDAEAIKKAGMGRYGQRIAEDIPPDLLEDYFIKQGAEYLVKRIIRQKIVFSTHDLLSDPPFQHIDLLLCRNLLIYMEPQQQHKLITNISFSLNPGNFLMLGSSESLTDLQAFFHVLDTKWRIFKLGKRIENYDKDLIVSRKFINSLPRKMAELNQAKPLDNNKLSRILMEKFIPPTIIVNLKGEVVYSYGNIHKYLHISTHLSVRQIYNTKIQDILPPEFKKIITEGMHTTFSTKNDHLLQVENIPENIAHSGPLSIQYIYLSDLFSTSAGVIISFVDCKLQERYLAQNNKTEGEINTVRNLESEIEHQDTKLKNVFQELESYNYELQNTNEELLSANEELHSTNEELQSVNEELYTVNTEYQEKIQELTELNSDLNNLLDNFDVGVIFLDTNLNIRKYTAKTKDIINILDADIGRPLSDFALPISKSEFTATAKNVIQQAESREKEVKVKNEWYTLKILPYYVAKNQIAGLLVAFIEITRLKSNNLQLSLLNEQLKKFIQIIEHLESAIIITDINGTIEYVNNKFLDIYGYYSDEVIGKNRNMLVYDKRNDSYFKIIKKQMEKGKVWKGKMTYKSKNGTKIVEQAFFFPAKDRSGKISHIIKIAEKL